MMFSLQFVPATLVIIYLLTLVRTSAPIITQAAHSNPYSAGVDHDYCLNLRERQYPQFRTGQLCEQDNALEQEPLL